MIINCGEEDEARNSINTRSPVTTFPCINGVCPLGTVPYETEGCECLPDCSMIIEYRTTGTSECSDENVIDWDGFSSSCACDFGFLPIGCPPWFTPQFDISTNEFIGCEIPDNFICYDGALNATIAGDCGTADGAGLVTTIVTIFVPPFAAVTLADLQNCDFTTGDNFVLALEDEYLGSNVAFVDDDGDGEIIIEFFRNPALQTLIAFDNTAQDILIPACPAFIPTMGTWALIILGFLMGIIGVVVVSRRRLSLD